VYRIDMEPIGRRIEIKPGQTLLDAAQQGGVDLTALCGGDGWCHGCKVRVVEGKLSPLTVSEEAAFTAEQIKAGYRLACQAKPLSHVKIDIPPESLATQQRLQVEGQDAGTEVDPVVLQVDISMPPATLHDLRAETVRVKEAAAAVGHPNIQFPLPILQELSPRLRAQGWSARLGIRNGEVVVLAPAGTRLVGFAVDVGTTKLAGYLVDLATGETLAKGGASNPQIGYGEDVISRISYTISHAHGALTLQRRLVETLNELAANLCEQAGASTEHIAEAVIVGNTAMQHLFARLPASQLALAPYVAAASEALSVRAADVGLKIAPAGYVYMPPNIAGYVGGDHVAMALGTGAWESDKTLVALDIGTNTEVTVARGGKMWCCSCASGPAFEGAHIRDGMRAAPGAIEKVQIVEGKVHLKTIEHQAPVGICGSGIMDIVSELFRTGVIDRKGAFNKNAAGVSKSGDLLGFTLAPETETGHGRPIVVTRKDVNEIQLAKSAIRTGVELLLQEAGASYDDIDEFIVAGAFGTYLDLESTRRVGMFPPLPLEKFSQVGNAAGTGARQLLVSKARRTAASRLADKVTYVELTIHPDFQKKYIKALYLD
jgi:uncharacterized 2Fe-2S/4Fe-4S cluster protein (DUF4445 family)